MISRSTLLHLRIPFSFYLMPVFFFGLTQLFTFMPPGNSSSTSSAVYSHLLHEDLFLKVILVFLIIHLFLYPASNGFNSYYDKDEQSIGGLENPPPVSQDLLYVSLLFDLIAVILGLLVSWEFAIMLFTYGLVSKAYSHPSIRLKKYGIAAWLTAGIFQGGFTLIMVTMALTGHGSELFSDSRIFLPASVATLMILGFYPLTQVYQHNEDARHGDNTISRQLGIKGTFVLSAIMFMLADIGFYLIYNDGYVFFISFSIPAFWFLQLFLAPVFGYFLWWFIKVRRDHSAANYRNTMRMNKVAAWCLVLFFLFLIIWPYLVASHMVDFLFRAS